MRSAWHHWVPAVIERKLVRLTFDLVVIPHNWDPSLLSMISFSVRKASSSRHAIWPGSSMMYFFVAELPFSFKPDRFNIMGGGGMSSPLLFLSYPIHEHYWESVHFCVLFHWRAFHLACVGHSDAVLVFIPWLRAIGLRGYLLPRCVFTLVSCSVCLVLIFDMLLFGVASCFTHSDFALLAVINRIESSLVVPLYDTAFTVSTSQYYIHIFTLVETVHRS